MGHHILFLVHRIVHHTHVHKMAKAIKMIKLADRQVPAVGSGAMGMSFGLSTNVNYEQAEPVLKRALDLGCVFWDTAVVYAAGINEKLLGDFIRKHNCRD